MNKNFIAKNLSCLQPYKITMSQNSLSAVELRIMAICLFKLKDEQLRGFHQDVTLTRKLFEELNHKVIKIKNADLSISDNYLKTKAALERLRKRSIIIKDELGTRGMGLIQNWWYSNDKSVIEIEIAKFILPELIALGKNYTKFGVEFCFKTQCKYAIRWYQLSNHWLTNGYFYIGIDDIRNLFKIDKSKYKQTRDFVKRVLNIPLKELKSKADIWLEITSTKKKGRKILGYNFKVHQKQQEHKKEVINNNIE